MTIPGLDVIYQPAGRAAEYAEWALRGIFRGCPHRCRYCYVPNILRMERDEFHGQVTVRPDFLKRLERDLDRIQRAGGWPAEHGSVLCCFSCDPLPWRCEHLHWVTHEVLGLLRAADVPVSVLTKNGAAAAQLIGTGQLDGQVFATSIVFDVQNLTSGWPGWEPDAPSLWGRWSALCSAAGRGIETWVSVEPVVDPDEALAVIRYGQWLGVVGHYKIGPLNHHPHAQTVDWRAFGERLAEVLMETGARYMVKRDMQQHMPPGFPAGNLED